MERSRLTITLRKDILPQIDKVIDGEKIRNRSHAIEYLVLKSLRSRVKKAYILAAGQGIKMRPFTYKMPKSMLPVKGKPILQHIIEQLRDNEIKDIIILVGHMAEKIKKYFGDGKKFGINITYVMCKKKIGTAKALLKAKKYLTDESFLMLYGDTLARVDLKDMLVFHKEEGGLLTVALTSVPNPEGYGVVKLRGAKILGFLEKPIKKPNLSRLISAGIFVIDPKILKLIPKKEYSKLEEDILPKLANEGSLYGYHFDGDWYDISTPEIYERVLKEWQA